MNRKRPSSTKSSWRTTRRSPHRVRPQIGHFPHLCAGSSRSTLPADSSVRGLQKFSAATVGMTDWLRSAVNAVAGALHASVVESLDLMSKLTALIPRPRTNVIRFHGVYAPNAKLRRWVIPVPPTHDACGHRIDVDPQRKTHHRLLWAQLLARVFQVDVFSCPRCSSRMSQISWILNKDSIREILDSVGLATDSPEAHPPRFEFEDDINGLMPVGGKAFAFSKIQKDATEGILPAGFTLHDDSLPGIEPPDRRRCPRKPIATPPPGG